MGNSAQAFQGFLGLGAAADMAKMAQFEAQAFDFFAVGAPLLNALSLGQFVQAINDFDRQFAVGGIGDVLSCALWVLHRGVDVNGLFQRRIAV